MNGVHGGDHITQLGSDAAERQVGRDGRPIGTGSASPVVSTIMRRKGGSPLVGAPEGREGLAQVAPDRSSECSRFQQHRRGVETPDKQMVQADLSKLVDEDRGVRKAGLRRIWRSTVVLPLPRNPVGT